MASLAPGQYFGTVIRSETVADFLLSDCVYAPNIRIPHHVHANAFFYFVLDGSSTEVYGRRTRLAEPSTLVFHPAGEEHANRWHERGGRCFHIEIASARWERIRACSPALLNEPAEYRAGLPVRLAARLFREFEQADAVTPLAVEGITLELLAETARHAPPVVNERMPPRWLRAARDLLHARFDEGLSLGDVAGAVNVHPAHLARAFRRQYGCTVGDYVRQLRIDWACDRIRAAETRLTDIALDAGFSDQSHFTRTFKRLVGMTPVEYQRRFRKSDSGTTR